MSEIVTVHNHKPESVDADALVVLLAATGAKGAARVLGDMASTLAAEIEDAVTALGLDGELESIATIPAPPIVAPRTLVLVGVGTVEGEPDAESVRRAVGAVLRADSTHASVAVVAPGRSAATVAATVEGAALGAYRYTRYKKPTNVPTVTVLSPKARSKDVKVGVERALVVAQAVTATRDLVNDSPSDLYPEAFVEAAKDAVKGLRIKVDVLDLKALCAGGYGGIVGVGQGSTHDPRLVTLDYAPSRARTHIALVGKGITFDSGGLSLKPPASMITMKCDMAGAAAVLSTVVAVARLGLPVRVTGFLALAENMPSGSAQRPGDIIRMRGDKTVEVLNTDAEGRLVMADALADAAALGPDAVIDIATLTGAAVVALGSRTTAVMGSQDVRDAVIEAAEVAGEAAWPMPLPNELRASLDSPVADLANVGAKEGGMLSAGIFLREFIGETPWAHLDIAGPAFNESSPWGYTPKGGTGAGVRTLLAYLEEAARA